MKDAAPAWPSLPRWGLLLVGLVIAAAAFIGLGTAPFWDPEELVYADAALDGAAGNAAPLMRLWVRLGFRLAGVGELGGRWPVALGSGLALAAIAYAATLLQSRRAALVAMVAWAATPALAVAGRHLQPWVPATLSCALWSAGLGQLFLGPLPRRRTWPHLLAALVGLAGCLALRDWPSAVAPLVALAACDTTRARHLVAALGRTRLARLATGLSVASLLLLLARVALRNRVQLGQFADGLSLEVRSFGLRLAPWSLLAPVVVVDAVAHSRRSDRFFAVLLVASFFLQPLAPSAGELPGGAFALFVLVARLLDGAPAEVGRPLLGLFIVAAAIVLGHDLATTPAPLMLIERAALPLPPWARLSFAAAVVAWSLLMALAVTRATAASPVQVALAIALPLVAAQLWAHPPASRSLYRQVAALDGTAPLLHYGCSERGARYQRPPGSWTTVASLPAAMAALAAPARHFLLVASDALPRIDEAARAQRLRYFVFDRDNRGCALLANRAQPGEPVLPPLYPEILDAAPHPQFAADAEWDHAIQLVGYDLPTHFSRGQPITLRLYFKVLQPLSDQNRLAVHLDGLGERIYANHWPLEGRYPTNHWPKGTYVVDSHVIDFSNHDELPDLRGTSGRFELFIGFYQGTPDVHITRGDSGDPMGRVHVATLQETE